MAYLPGHRPVRETVHIDYADVLAQAVANERHRILRAVRADLGRVRFFDAGYEWEHKPRKDPKALQREVLAVVERLETE